MTLETSKTDSKFSKMEKPSNELIKKFKKSKGTEYTDAIKKRKSGTFYISLL